MMNWQTLGLGLRVVRGPDWEWNEQDGGEGHAGTVVEVGVPPSYRSSDSNPTPCSKTSYKTVIVQWDHGSRWNYRIGYQGCFDLLVFDNAQIGVKHPNIKCNGCSTHEITGIRWKCRPCGDYNLCTKCYMSDVHDLTHCFERIQSPNYVGVQLTPREGCTKIQLKGIFAGAQVVRGPDWGWGDQDGGKGKAGTVVGIGGWDNQDNRSVATVKWSKGNKNVYRVGYKGWVDLSYVEEATAGTYYKEHLPLLALSVLRLSDNEPSEATRNAVPSAVSCPPNTTFNDGDKVKVLVDVETLKEMQEGHGGWNPRMAQYIGKIGRVHRITDKGNVRVEFEGCHNRWTFHPGALTKVTSKDTFALGDIVRVKTDLSAVKLYQRGHGEWTDVMKNALGKTGKVIKIYSDGDLRVALDGHTWTFNPLSVVLVPPGVENVSVRDEANRSRDTTGVDTEVELLLWDVVRGEAGVPAVQEFLKKYPGRVDARAGSRDGKKTFLHVAAHGGQRDLCTFLLDAGASLTAVDEDGDTPLHHATFGNQPQIMELLLSRNAPINAVNYRKCSALHVAVINQHAQCVKVLLRHQCNVNLQDSYGDTALHDAIGKGDPDIIDALCACPTVDFTLTNEQDFNVLHHAALKGNAHAAEKILARAKCLVNVKKDDGFAALHLAALNGHLDVAAILLVPQGGNGEVDLRNNRRQTPLLLAISQGHWALVELLIRHGAHILNADADGDTVLHIAILKRYKQASAAPTPERCRDSPRIYEIWQNLERQGAKTELALTCFLVSMDTSCILLEYAINKNNQTPMDLVEADPQIAPYVDLLRSYQPQPRSSQLELQIGPSSEPSTYRLESTVQLRVMGDDRPGTLASGDSSEGHSSIVTDSQQSATGEIPVAKPDENVEATALVENKDKENVEADSLVESKDKQKAEDKELDRLRYLETRVAVLEEATICSVCLERRREVVFLCGHGTCAHCAAPLKTCHMCRQFITKKIQLY